MPYKQSFANVFSDWRLICFAVALGLYALWGSPTPNNPDWVEGVIALFLFVAIGWQSIIQNFFFYKDQKLERWHLSGKILLLYGLTVGVVIAVIQGNDFNVIVRDLIAFVFLCLPLFFIVFLKEAKVREKAFTMMCLIIGLVFSIRVLVPHFLLFRNTTELLYLANSPLVLMSALLLGGYAGHYLYKNMKLNNMLKAIVFVALCSLPIMAMFVDLQRASFAVLVFSVLSLSLIGFVKAPIRMILPLTLLLSASFLVADYFAGVIENVEIKTSKVGLNMRAQEFFAVWKDVSETPFTILFGQGWGTHFASPAVGELNITYTHSFLTYIFLKTGFIGLFLSLAYLFFIFEKWARLYFSNPVKGNALIWPLLIPIFLYASHKSFDFGLLLCLIVISTHQLEARRS